MDAAHASKTSKKFAPIAQLVELRPLKPKVPGSSPGGGTDRKQNTPLLADY